MGEIPVFHNSGIWHFEAIVQFWVIPAQKAEQIPNFESRVLKHKFLVFIDEFLIFFWKSNEIRYTCRLKVWKQWILSLMSKTTLFNNMPSLVPRQVTNSPAHSSPPGAPLPTPQQQPGGVGAPPPQQQQGGLLPPQPPTTVSEETQNNSSYGSHEDTLTYEVGGIWGMRQ